MGILQRLFGRGQRGQQERVAAGEPGVFPGSEDLEVVGESHYQEALWRIVGGWTKERVRHPVVAVLRAEPSNQHDRNAIAVFVSGHLVGYLPREVAAAYQPGLLGLQARHQRAIALEGVVVGGGMRADGPGMLGVFLSHDPRDFGVGSDLPPGKMYEGTSTESAHGHLQWMARLPNDDRTAIVTLRKELASVHGPIDRHYLYQELEKRLYRCRMDAASMLDEFDATCAAHDAEMDTIRPALIADLGAVPHLTLYHQMAIRQAKALCWELGLEWAERGLAQYGGQPASAEWRDELARRAESFRSKIAKSAIDSHRTASRCVPAPVDLHQGPSGSEETLTCGQCGHSFIRIRRVGRKPRLCPTCQAQLS